MEVKNLNKVTEVKEVKEVDSDNEVNRLLNDGWILLAATAFTTKDQGAYVLYSLGRI